MENYNQNQFSLGINNFNEDKEYQTEKNQIKKNPKNKSNQIIIQKKRYSRSPKESINDKNQLSKSKDSFKNKRSPSPKFKESSYLMPNDKMNYTIIKKKMNIIEGNEDDLKKLRLCEKEYLPKEKTYIITESNFKKIMELVKEKENTEKDFENLNEKIKTQNEKIVRIEEVNKLIISRNNEFMMEIKKTKKEYDDVILELNIYEKIINRFIYLTKYISNLFPNDERILKIINEVELNGLLNNFENSNISISDLISKDQNELNEKLIEKTYQLRDIEDTKYLFDNIQGKKIPHNELTKQLTDKLQRIIELTTKYNKLEYNYIYLQSKLNNLIVENNEQINKINKEIEVYKIQISQLTNEKISLVNENEKLKNKIGEMDKNNNNEHSIKTLNSNINSSNLNNNSLKIDELNVIIQNKDNMINEYKKKIEVLQNDNNILNQTKNNLLKRSDFENNKNNEIIYNNNYNNNDNKNNISKNENNENHYYTELNHENYMNLNINNNSLNEDNKNNLLRHSQGINTNNKLLNEFKINTQSSYRNNYFKDAKLDLDMKLLKKKTMEDERNMYFTGEDKEIGINGVAYISDLFLDLYNQSKLIEEIIDKTEIK